MVFGNVVSSQRGHLSPQQSLNLANIYLECAGKAQDTDIALALCQHTEVSLFQAKKAVKHADDQTMRRGFGTAYIGFGRVLDKQGRISEAKTIDKKAEKLG